VKQAATSDSVLLKASEAAELVGCHVETIHRRIREGSLPAVRIGDGPKAQVRIDSADLAEWLDHNVRRRTGVR
jgi:excisionase family DNA binding protein